MDNTIDFETDQDLAQWQWLSGALQQHHYALAMLMELCMNSRRKDASRLLRGLAYVFEPPDHMRPLEWIPYTVRLIRDRMKVYVNARKVRAPIGFMEQLRLESPPEASEGSSSVEREQTREGSQQSQTSSQMSVEQQEGLQSQSVGSATRQTPPLMPSQSESNSGSESPTAGMPTVSTKDIMDVDWVGQDPVILLSQSNMICFSSRKRLPITFPRSALSLTCRTSNTRRWSLQGFFQMLPQVIVAWMALPVSIRVIKATTRQL